MKYKYIWKKGRLTYTPLYIPHKDPQRVSKYKNVGLELDEALEGIQFPVELTS